MYQASLLTDNPIKFFHQIYVLEIMMSISQLGALREMSSFSKITDNKVLPPTLKSIPDHH